VLLLEELNAIGVGFVSLNEGIDLRTPAGILQFQILAALSEFERARIQERVRAGLATAKAQGVRLGRPNRKIPHDRVEAVRGLPVREAAERLGVSRSTAQRWLTASQ
jgi:DNA invertase Pin-like site-specific DNA recombinase